MYDIRNIPSLTFAVLFKRFCDQLPQFTKTVAPNGWEHTPYYSFYDTYIRRSYKNYRYERRDMYRMTKTRFKNYPKLIPPLMSLEEYKENSLNTFKSEKYFFLTIFSRLVYDFLDSHPPIDEKDGVPYFPDFKGIEKALEICWEYLNTECSDSFKSHSAGSPFYSVVIKGSGMNFTPFYRVLFENFDVLPGSNWSYQHSGLCSFVLRCWEQYYYESIDSPHEIDLEYIDNLNPYYYHKNWLLLREQLINSSEFVLLANMEKDLINIINKINSQKPHDVVFAYTDVFGDYPPGYIIDPDQYVYA